MDDGHTELRSGTVRKRREAFRDTIQPLAGSRLDRMRHNKLQLKHCTRSEWAAAGELTHGAHIGHARH